MKRRAEIDQKAWAILAERMPFACKLEGFAHSGRPANSEEFAIAAEAYDD